MIAITAAALMILITKIVRAIQESAAIYVVPAVVNQTQDKPLAAQAGL